MGSQRRDVGGVYFYWRPGCVFCALLRARLTRRGVTLLPVDIWRDERAAALVRSVAGGCETVPTVVVGTRALVNPSPGEVLTALAEEAAHLLPSEPPARPGRLRRLLGHRS